MVHVAFIVALGADDGHILSLRLLPAEALRADIGPLSLGWRLAWPRMASNLVLHLLEGEPLSLLDPSLPQANLLSLLAVAAFSSVGLPAFEPLLAKVSLYRSKIQDLSPASKVRPSCCLVISLALILFVDLDRRDYSLRPWRARNLPLGQTSAFCPSAATSL